MVDWRDVGEPLRRVRALWSFDRGQLAQPSPTAKRRQLLGLFRERDHRVLVESGTYRGGTVAFFLPHAERIISVEIDPALHQQALLRFRDAPNVDLRLGDALDVVPAAVAEQRQSCLVWLDGHFSGGVTGRGQVSEPAIEVLRRLGDLGMPPGTTIVVDDLRMFGRGADVPPLDELVDAARGCVPGAQLTTGLDCLIIQS
jgi:hypothetical protein